MPTTSNIAYCQSACRVQRNASAGGALACGRKRDLVGRSTGAEMDTPSLRPLRDVVGPYSLVHRSSRHETPEECVIAGLGASPGLWPQSLALTRDVALQDLTLGWGGVLTRDVALQDLTLGWGDPDPG